MEGDRGQPAMSGLKQARLLKFEHLIERDFKAFGLKDANGAFGCDRTASPLLMVPAV
jgi:hypothetical protein